MEEKLAKFFSGEATEEERKEVLEWRSASESNSAEYLEAKNLWIISSTTEGPNQQVLTQILEEKDEKIIPMWKNNFIRVAASVAIILGVAFAIYQQNTPESIIVAESTMEQALPDGSMVTLHRGASVSIGDFKNERSVRLNGKAYFDVVRDESKPFVIITDKAKVEVLGTSFVVNSSESQEVEVLVESGLVGFSDLEEQSEVKIAKGEMAALDGITGVIVTKPIEDVNYLAWKTMSLNFKKQQLIEVAKVIKDVYDVNLVFDNSELAKCSLTGSYQNKSVLEVTEIISETFGLEYRVEGDEIHLTGAACN